MLNNMEQYIVNLRSILEEKGFEDINIVIEDSNVIVTTRRFGLSMKMKFAPEELGLI